ncbi:MAG TPA: hypothetical protein VFI39_10020 [Gemmatimonadales bacterium]|nr:hypothetical protein [Gemmatimonadales bacterium]
MPHDVPPSLPVGRSAPVSQDPPGRRPWATPQVEPLPKLTELTLLSPIGGGGGIGGSTVFGLLLAAGLLFGIGACSDGIVRPSASGGPATISQLITCRAVLATGTVSCGGPARTSGTTTLGGQGLNVGLRSSNTSYVPGTGIFSADVTVQNLTGGPIGTTDGTTKSSGVSVFFVSGPTPDVGTASVANPTGTSTFTANDQPYFLYDALLTAQMVSAPETWQFQLGGAATSFTFAVLVSADVPVQGGVLRWTTEPAFLGTEKWQLLRGWGNGFALFGDQSEVLVYSGGQWSSRYDPANVSLHTLGETFGASAAGPGDIMRYATDFSIRLWDGISWRAIQGESNGPPASYASTFGYSAGTGDYATGLSSFWMHSGNGWIADTLPTGETRLDASTPVLGDVLTISDNGLLWFHHQHSWTRVDSTSSGMGSSFPPYLVLAPDTNHVWAFAASFGGNAAEYWNGTRWSVPPLPGTVIENYFPTGGYAVDSDDVYLTAVNGGAGYLWHWDGSNWNTLRNTGFSGPAYSDVWVASNGNVYLAESQGIVEMDSAGTWSTLVPGGSGVTTTAVSVLSSTDAYVGTQAGQVYHYDGRRWIQSLDVGGGFITAVWAAGPSDVWEASNNVFVQHYDGANWTQVYAGTASGHGLGGSGSGNVWEVADQGQVQQCNVSSCSTAVAASSLTSNNLYGIWAANDSFAVAVGGGGAILVFDSSAWTAPASPTTNQLNAVSGTSPTDVWAVGNAGTIVHWNGSSWTVATSGTSNNLTGVWARGASEVYAVGAGGTVLRYDGSTWAPMAVLSATGQNYSGISGVASGFALVTGTWMLRANP